MIPRDTIARVVSALTRLMTGATARWGGPLPADVQRVYFANHTSHLDTLVLWSLLPLQIRLQTRPVAAREFWEANRLRSFTARTVFNAVLIERPTQGGNGSAMQGTLASQAFAAMLTAMEHGSSLILFPEGTRGSGHELRPFKSGLYHLARKMPGVEMVPVYLENLNRILPKGELLPIPLLVSVSFGAPMHLEGQESKTSFLERARHAIEVLKV